MKLSKRNTLFSIMVLFVSGLSNAACNSNIPATKPNSIYVFHGDGTVTDVETGLMWRRCSLGLSKETCTDGSVADLTWKEALEAAQTANSGAGTFGYNDWRLPSAPELNTLIERRCEIPAMNWYFANNDVWDAGYWTSTPSLTSVNHLENTEYAYAVDFGFGQMWSFPKSNLFHVRLVRGGY